MPTGLTTVEAKAKQTQFGKNVFIEREEQSAFKTFLEEFKSPLVIMLLVAAAISFISGSNISGILIIVIILVSSIIDFVVSYKSQKAAHQLAHQIEPHTKVLRNGLLQDIHIEELVPGDVVFLEAGNVVPADGDIVEGNDFFTNESSLTGESIPVEKNMGAGIYLGSGVVSGKAYVEIKKTGHNTKFAEVVSLLSAKEPLGEFEEGIKQFSFLITRIVLVMSTLVFVVNAFTGHSTILQSLIFSLALAVGITPELLPMIIALNVSKASLKMSKKGVIVKKLSAIENFGGMNILCTDKTGTLTEDKITVVRYVDIDGKDSEKLLKLGYIASTLHTGTKGALDVAISAFKNFSIGEYKKVDEIPFDFERRRDSLVVDHAQKRIMLVKGAPEEIFQASCLSELEALKARGLFEKLSADGYRVIGIASKEVAQTKTSFSRNDEQGLHFEGFIAFIDPPKKGVKEVLARLKKRNIEIKIVTGDHRLVAEKIATEVGLVSLGTLEAGDIDALSDEDLMERTVHTTLFVRVTPVQKNRIIKMLQKKGNVVGYMGDGINDAPALRAADVGISVNNAVDVAKESADVILLTKSLRQLIDGVIEGRRTFANTIKYIAMAVSSNFGNMFSMTGASLVLPFLPMLPTQLLLNNLLYESSQFALTFDNVDDDILNHPNPWNIEFIKKFMVVFGILSSIFDFITFYVLYKVFMLAGSGFQTSWFIESFATQTLVIFFIRTHRFFFKGSKPHIAVVLSALIAVAVAWLIALSSIGSKLFEFTPIPMPVMAFILVIIVCYFITVEVGKYVFYKKVRIVSSL